MEQNLLEALSFSLNNYLYSNAVFLAERLHALKGDEHNLNVLADCYLRSGQVYKAYAVLKVETAHVLASFSVRARVLRC
jgi:anaphase-promoting complex subunit 3